MDKSATCTVDCNGMIRSYNDEAKQLFQLPSPVDTYFFDLIDPVDVESVQTSMNQFVHHTEFKQFYVRLNQQAHQTYLVQALPLITTDGREILFHFQPCHRFEKEIQAANMTEQFIVYYQPLYNMEQEKITGFEALLRWNHPELGVIPPVDFIPLLEENGMIDQVGEHVFYQACKQMKTWHNNGYTDLSIHINLSVKQLESDTLTDTFANIIHDLAIDPTKIVVEITESMLVDGDHRLHKIIADLQALGLGVSMDDFGTGFSSLSYLSKLSMDSIKLDKSFLDQMVNKREQMVLKSIISLANDLRLTIIAEGVESREHISFLLEHDCYLMQGFYFSKPLPVSEANKLLDSTVGRGKTGKEVHS